MRTPLHVSRSGLPAVYVLLLLLVFLFPPRIAQEQFGQAPTREARMGLLFLFSDPPIEAIHASFPSPFFDQLDSDRSRRAYTSSVDYFLWWTEAGFLTLAFLALRKLQKIRTASTKSSTRTQLPESTLKAPPEGQNIPPQLPPMKRSLPGAMKTQLEQSTSTKANLGKDTNVSKSTLLVWRILAVSAAFIHVGFLIFLIPVFTDMFADFGAELPWATQLVIEVSDILRSHFLVMLLTLSVLVVSVIRYDPKKDKISRFRGLLNFGAITALASLPVYIVIMFLPIFQLGAVAGGTGQNPESQEIKERVAFHESQESEIVRFGIKRDEDKFPQTSHIVCVESALKAVTEGELDYLVAHLVFPEEVSNAHEFQSVRNIFLEGKLGNLMLREVLNGKAPDRVTQKKVTFKWQSNVLDFSQVDGRWYIGD